MSNAAPASLSPDKALKMQQGELNDKHQRSSIGGWRLHNLPWEQC